ncbi:hypothetical protein LVJ94_52820 [Pendulispora rubella]|uniref:Uncharacterized protein n=1 Tax=Pendulispora rubella TaxID=2741070 RepID=A0ABZ2L4B0_9BACT
MRHCFLERTIPLSLAAFVVLSGRSTYAQNTVSLEWNAPLAECGDGAAVEVEVNRLLGGQPVAPEKRVRARVRIERATDGAWHVDLVTERRGTRGERTLSAASCRAAADATALILALIIDPTQVAATRTPTGAAPSSDTPVMPGREAPATVMETSAVEVTPAPSPPSVAASDRAPRPQATAPKKDDTTALAAGVSGLGDLGALPTAAAGIGIFVAWTPGRARIEASGVDYPDSTTHAMGGGGGSFHLATGALRGCYAVNVHSPFESSPCVGFEAGAMGGDGFGVATPGSGTAFWAASVVGGLFAYRLTPHIALRLDTGLSVAFVRPRFVLDNAGFVHRPSALGGRMAFGMEVRF